MSVGSIVGDLVEGEKVVSSLLHLFSEEKTYSHCALAVNFTSMVIGQVNFAHVCCFGSKKYHHSLARQLEQHIYHSCGTVLKPAPVKYYNPFIHSSICN